MPIFYPPLDFETDGAEIDKANPGERAVLESFSKGLDDTWHVFHGFTWRVNNRQGERIGEADVIVFHPRWGLLVFEVKGGSLRSSQGKWYQTDLNTGIEHPLKMAPMDQARRSRYYIADRLMGTSLGKDLSWTALTHAACFPDISSWTAPTPPEVPNSSYLLCSLQLNDPERYIRSILLNANPHPREWDQREIDILIRTLCPDINLLVPLCTKLGRLRDRIFKMTEAQIQVSRMLRNLKRLLVEGCAGSGKTLLAAALAREHLTAGKRVLFTCYNTRLAAVVQQEFEGVPNIDVINFHELARVLCIEAGIAYDVPADAGKRADFFKATCPELIMDCAGRIEKRYDTIIVDEAFDFRETWWLALESLGANDFSFYAFYDRNQSIFNEQGVAWAPPFAAEPVTLDRNVRNTGPIGRYAARLGKVVSNVEYGVNDGPEPREIHYTAAAEIPAILSQVVNGLLGRDKVSPDDIVVLSPYKLENERVGLAQFVVEQAKTYSTDMSTPEQGKVRIGTIQAFKGLEADVVILCGIDGHEHACSPANLYVGATRARSMLVVIKQKDFAW